MLGELAAHLELTPLTEYNCSSAQKVQWLKASVTVTNNNMKLSNNFNV